MVRKKLDERIRTLIHRSIATHQRSLLFLVGDHGKDQVPNLYQILCRATPLTKGKSARPSILWCYKKQLGFSTHKQKRMKKLKRAKSKGLLKDTEDVADNFELFVSGTDITWCYYRDTHRVLGTTHGVLVLQDFEALTPNLLARTIETVEGGGMVIFLLRTVKSLKQLYSLTMDVHSRYRTESGGDVVPRFNERFLLSLTHCTNCLVCDDELNILPLSRTALQSLSSSSSKDGGDGHVTTAAETGEVLIAKTTKDVELEELQSSLVDTPHVGAVVELARTLDQARAILVFLDACSDKKTTGQPTLALTAARGRGKSAAIGLCLAGAMSLGYSMVAVTAPEPENLVSVFDFLLRGLKALKYQEHLDFTLTYNAAHGREETKCIVGVDIYRDHRQSIKYIRPDEADKFASAEIVAIDEAAAIPLPIVRALMTGGGDRLTFLSSTVNGYEGTGRALSLKLIKELRDAKGGGRGGANAAAAAAAAAAADVTGGKKRNKGEEKVHEQRWAAAAAAAKEVSSGSRSSSLLEVELTTPIRYAEGDGVEAWLNKLLCLDCGTELSPRLKGGAPAPSSCDLYCVDRDALFSYHKLSERFLQKLMGLYTSAHYKNTPNDLQMLSDAPAHAVFVLLSPSAEDDSESLPDILAVIQVALEGQISRKAVEAQLARGHRSAGDLIPWTISQQFGDSNFAQLSGARIVRVAVHPTVQGMGYGSRAVELLYRYYNGEMINLAGDVSDDDEDESANSESEEEDGSEGGGGGKTGIKGERLKPRKKLPPLLLPLTEVKAPRLDWIGTSFGLTNELFRFWQRAGMKLLYLRQTKNELTGEHSSILVRALPRRSGFDDAWLPAFASDTRRRLIALLSGPFQGMEVRVATSILSDLEQVGSFGERNAVDEEVKRELSARSGSTNDSISASELNYFLTPHDLKRLELYGRNLCDHHLVTDLLPPVARLYFTGRFGSHFQLSSLQSALFCGIGLQHKSVDNMSSELRLPANQVLSMFNKAVRKMSIALHTIVEESEKSKLLSAEKVLQLEALAQKHKNVTEQTLEEDTKEGSKIAMAMLKKQASLPPQITNDYELRQHTVHGSDEQWESALKKSSSAVAGDRGSVQIVSEQAMPPPAKRKHTDDGDDGGEGRENETLQEKSKGGKKQKKKKKKKGGK